jgi:hypothetical protein
LLPLFAKEVLFWPTDPTRGSRDVVLDGQNAQCAGRVVSSSIEREGLLQAFPLPFTWPVGSG